MNKWEREANRSSNLDGIDTSNVAVQTLPSGNPTSSRIGQSDKTLKDLTGALLDGVVVASQLEELFAVGASLTTEAGTWQDDAADHAGAQRAVLTRRHKAGHGDGGWW
jgi:hypothetical protein